MTIQEEEHERWRREHPEITPEQHEALMKKMGISEEEHERWHREHPEITPEQHEALMKKMGISEEEDREWHTTHGMSSKSSGKPEQKPVNPFAIGRGFLDYCVQQGWLIQEGKGRNATHYLTKEGEKELRKFGIRV